METTTTTPEVFITPRRDGRVTLRLNDGSERGWILDNVAAAKDEAEFLFGITDWNTKDDLGNIFSHFVCTATWQDGTPLATCRCPRCK